MTDKPLYEWFAATARRLPDKPALEVRDETLTYRQLDAAAGRIAGLLLADGCFPPRRLALLCSRQASTFAGYLAALRLAATIVPLNPGFPVARNAAIATKAGVDMLLADEAHANQLRAIAERTGVPGRTLRDIGRTEHAGHVVHPMRQPAPADVAYVLFTSGSTGTPKGVPIRHRDVSAYLTYNIACLGAEPGTRWAQQADLTFDASIAELFLAWSCGGTLVVATEHDRPALVRFLRDRSVTHCVLVPSVVTLAQRFRALGPAALPGLRHTVFIGERLTFQQAEAWHEAAPDSVIENVYGPTEVTVGCTAFRLPRQRSRWPSTSNGSIPIGTPYPHLEHIVIGEHGRAAARGELCLRGRQRFAGYLDPEHDRERFVTFDGGPARVFRGDGPLTEEHWYRTGDLVSVEDGYLVHLDRLDQQVKLHGYRIELGEIEATIRQHTAIVDAFVVPVAGAGGKTELVAVCLGDVVSERQLIALVEETLPLYMLPARFEFVNEVPRNANGKVDRRALAEALSVVTGRDA